MELPALGLPHFPRINRATVLKMFDQIAHRRVERLGLRGQDAAGYGGFEGCHTAPPQYLSHLTPGAFISTRISRTRSAKKVSSVSRALAFSAAAAAASAAAAAA